MEEKENLVSRSGRPTSEPYSLNSYATSLLARLNNAVKVKTVASATKHRSKGRQFLRLPDHLPPINPYAWPPDSLYRATVSPSYPQIQKVRSDFLLLHFHKLYSSITIDYSCFRPFNDVGYVSSRVKPLQFKPRKLENLNSRCWQKGDARI